MKKLTCLKAAIFLIFAFSWAAGNSIAAESGPANSPFPSRIIPMTPALAELLSVFKGGTDRILAVTEYADFPEQLQKKEKIGGYHHLNFERISALKPDLIIAAEGGNASFEVEILKKQHPDLLILRENSFSDLLVNVTTIGEKIGRKEEAAEWKKNWTDQKEAILGRAKGRPQKTVLVLVDENPLLVAGGPTYFTELLTWIGAKNVFSDLNVKYPRISKEELLKRNPDVIITLGQELTPAFRKLFKDSRAVTEKRLFLVKSDALARPGPRMFEAADLLAKVIYADDKRP